MKRDERRKLALGIDFGATNLKALLINDLGEVKHRYVEASLSGEGPEKTISRIVILVERAREDAEALGVELKNIGIGACAPIDYSKGEIIESPVLPSWRNVPLVSAIKDCTGITVQIENDGNSSILGEWWQGAGHRSGIVAGLTLGTGIGGGFLINGRIYRGSAGFGSEFGHIQVTDNPPCPCGGNGCVGRVASATATIQRYRELTGENDALPENDIIELAKRAKNGDQAAENAIKVSIHYLCKACLIIINCLNPNVFLLTGGMSLLGETISRPIREYVIDSTFKEIGMHTDIGTGTLGIYSGCYGAAYLALSKVKVLPC